MTTATQGRSRLGGRAAYLLGLATALGTALLLVYLVAAVGVMAEEGYRGDLAYAGILMSALGGAVVSRGRAPGLSDTSFATAIGLVGVALLAALGGVHERAATSAAELLGLNAMFAAGFALAGLLFRRSAPGRPG